MRLADPRGSNCEVGGVEQLKHVPPLMKYVVKLLELFVRSTPFSPFTPESGEGGWYSATVRLTQTGETMLIVNFVSKVRKHSELGAKFKICVLKLPICHGVKVCAAEPR